VWEILNLMRKKLISPIKVLVLGVAESKVPYFSIDSARVIYTKKV